MIGRPQLARRDVVAFLPILAANLVPLGGITLFDWRVSELLVIYWIEVCVMLFLYSVVALFAKRPIVTDRRTFYLPGVSEDDDCGSKLERKRVGISVPGPLPPIYPHDLGVILLSFGWGAAFWIGPILAFEIQEVVLEAFSPLVVATTGGIVLSHLIELRREFFGAKKYTEMSAHMVLEIPLRIILFPIVLFAFIVFFAWPFLAFVFLILPEAMGISWTAPRIEFVFVTTVVLLKLTVEWARFWADRDPDPGRVTRWFLPQDPRKT
jgi:hypothetical protein